VTELHARLHDNARHDALTGLSNRLRLAEDLDLLCGRVERYGHTYCVALFDVDDFKGINDASGHIAGDGVLRSVAQALARQIRTGDAIYRYGGEEFLVLLPEQTIESAALAAERLRAGVEALALPHPGGGVVTISAGVAGASERGCQPDELFKLADEALYRAKAGGRNRVEVHGGADQQEEAPVRLLIADDDPGTRLVLTALLAREDGFELVGEAETGGDSVELAATLRPDLVLMDVNLPDIDGFEATRRIREAAQRPPIVVMLSTYEAVDYADRAIAAGAAAFLSKSTFTPEELRRVWDQASAQIG
jgi:diguanylate cyclase (GGDEF)-like protein